MYYGDGSEYDKLEAALEAADMAWWWIELPSGVVMFSPNKAAMLGRTSKDFKHYSDFVNIVHPDDRARIMQDMRDHIDGVKPLYETIYRIQKKSGDYVQFYDRGKIVARQDGEVVIAGIVFDMTNMKFDHADAHAELT